MRTYAATGYLKVGPELSRSIIVREKSNAISSLREESSRWNDNIFAMEIKRSRRANSVIYNPPHIYSFLTMFVVRKLDGLAEVTFYHSHACKCTRMCTCVCMPWYAVYRNPTQLKHNGLN